MKRRVVAIAVTLVAIASLVFAGSNGLPTLSPQPEEQETRPSLSAKKSPDRKRDYVDMKSDEGWQMTHNGQKIMVVVGNFAAHHNGTVITADSAVRYSERHIECFGNVLINKGTTYIYGDRAEYDGDTNEAKVFSNIVKVVDGSATLLTYNFTFNTKTNIGHYTGGGVLTSNDNILESDRGYVYSDLHQIICVDRVQMQNNDYDMMGDSVVYNTETDFAEFFTHTNIWNKGESKSTDEQEYLYTDRGSFDKAKQLYKLTLNGYVLTKEQEMLSDSVDYYRDSNYILLRNNIQIDDTSQKMIIFADWGEYWKEPGNIFATKEPAIVTYDLSQSDSVFVRSDSMYIYTRYPIREKIEKARQDSLAMVAKQLQDSLELAAQLAAQPQEAPTAENKKESKKESKREERKEEKQHKDKHKENKVDRQPTNDATPATAPATAPATTTTPAPIVESNNTPTKATQQDSVAVAATADTVVVDTATMSKRERERYLRAEAAKANRAVKEALQQREAERKAMLKERNTLRLRLLGEARVRDAERKRKEKERRDSLREVAKLAKDSVAVDSVKIDTLKKDSIKRDSLKVDSLKIDSLKRDTLKIDTLRQDSVKVGRFDTMTAKQVKAHFKAIADREKDSINRIKQDSLDAKLDRIADARQAKRTAIYKRWERRDSIYRAKAEARAYEQLKRRIARREKRGIFVAMADSSVLRQIDSLLGADIPALDEEARHQLDSLIEIYFPKEIPSPSKILAADSMNIDSFYRDIRAFSHVKMYRSDAQSICDSLTMTTLDTIIHLYKSPVLWNGPNQISSEIMHLTTRDSRLTKAQFEGKPMTIAQIDTAHYNQVTGKEMTSLFENNEIYRNDVNGNVQTIYYMQEDNSPDITMMAYIEAGDMTSYIKNKQIVGITYRGNPTYTFYPMDKIPDTQPTRLQGFKWEANRRPTRDSLFMRVRRPSQRSEKMSLRRPLFPINALMQQRRDDYLRRGEWRDRTDTLTVETIEWLEAIRSEY